MGYCFFLSRMNQQATEASLFIIVSSIITLFYIASLCGVLQPTAWITLIGGWSALLATPWCVEKNWRLFLNKYITPGFICSLFVIIIFCLMAQHLMLTGEDELTHWGVVAKLIYYYNGLIPGSKTIIHASYPPGSAFLYYFFFLGHGFSEGNAYFAQSLLFLAPLSLTTTKIEWKHWPRALGILLIAVTGLYLLQAKLGPYINLYIDTGIGIFWGSIVLYSKFFIKKAEGVLYLIPLVCCLSLFKLGLEPLILLSLILVFSQQACVYQKKFKLSLYLLIVFLSSFLIAKSWQWHLTSIHVPIEWKLHPSFHLVFSALDPRLATAREKITISHFIHALTKPLLLGILFSFIAFVSALSSKNISVKREVFIGQVLLWIGAILYLATLLLLYLFSFTAGEGEHLASMDRYASIYYMGWFIITYGEVIMLARSYKPKFLTSTLEKILGYGCVAILIAGFFISNHHQKLLLSNITANNYLKMAVRKITDPVNQLTPPNSRIFTVWQNSTGEGRSMVVYNTVPRTPNLSYTSFGKPYSSTDQWTVNLSPQVFLNELRGFDYLLLARTDSQFWQQYGSAFPATPPTLKPSAIYHICILPGFNGVNKRGCKLSEQQSYLFKIENKHGKVRLINMPMKGGIDDKS